MVGLRGVGKTVLLDRMRDDAEATGIHTMRIEAPENRSPSGAPALASYSSHPHLTFPRPTPESHRSTSDNRSEVLR